MDELKWSEIIKTCVQHVSHVALQERVLYTHGNIVFRCLFIYIFINILIFVLSNSTLSIFWRKKCSDIFHWKLFFRLFGFKFALDGANTIKKLHLGVLFIFLDGMLRHSFFSMQQYITPVLDLMPCLKAWGTKDFKQKGH